MTTKVQTLVITRGYVEDQKLASVIVHHPVGFGSIEEAIDDIASVIVGCHLAFVGYENWVPKCCREDYKKGNKYCHVCNRHLFPEVDFDFVHYIIRKYLDGTIDGTGETYEMWDWDVGMSCYYDGENPFAFPTAVIHSNGASMLAHAYMGTFGNLESGNMPEKFRRRIGKDSIILIDKSVKIYKD